MSIQSKHIFNLCKTLAVALALAVAGLPGSASAATAMSRTQIHEAQVIMRKFSLPAGEIDSTAGPLTSRGLCVFRSIAKLPVSREGLDGPTLERLRKYDRAFNSLRDIPAPRRAGEPTYLVVNKTCQTMVYVKALKYNYAMAVSTGDPNLPDHKGIETVNGTYRLGATEIGWHCSTQSRPEACHDHPNLPKFGRFASTKVNPKGNGNMYNQRHIYNGVYLHGSTFVPTYPNSHGCIRVTPVVADWMYDNVGNRDYPNPPIIVTGAYRW